MMAVDTSALAAIFFMESDALAFSDALQEAPQAWLSAANFLEIAIIIDNRDSPEQLLDLDAFLVSAGIQVVAVTAAQVRIARVTYQRFGKGNHPARLNFGDCFAYALAKERDLPLLFKGGDFAKTDIRPAL
jgi:ribonuclease VapC